MLTVKHIQLSGHEDIYPARTVSYQPSGLPYAMADNQLVPSSNPPCCFIDGENAAPRVTVYGGTVFVMNEHGKTISRYDLGASMASPEHDPSGPPTN